MAEQKSFKTRVREEVVRCARLYKEVFVDYDYLIFSTAFEKADYYMIQAHEDNYKHLTGVSSELGAAEFFWKCYEETLTEEDFSFAKKNQIESVVKGSVRDKIRVLPEIEKLFSEGTIVEEDFRKNSIRCSFAAGQGTFTMGFVCVPYSRPKTLLRGNELNPAASKRVELVLRRRRGTKKFDEVLVGNELLLQKYADKIGSMI